MLLVHQFDIVWQCIIKNIYIIMTWQYQSSQPSYHTWQYQSNLLQVFQLGHQLLDACYQFGSLHGQETGPGCQRVGCQFCWWSDALTASSACSLSLSKSTRMTWVIKGSCDENTMKGNNLSQLPKGTRGWHIRFHMHGVEVGIQRVHVPFHHFRHLPLGTTLNASPRFSSTETWA